MTESTPSDEELLLDLLTGFLEPAAATELEARLEAEPELRALHERLQVEQSVLEAALGSEDAVEDYAEAPAGLSERVLAGIPAQEQAPAALAASPNPVSGPPPSARGVLVGRRSSGVGRRWALLAAALLVTAGLVAVNAYPRVERPQQVMNRQVRTSELLALGILPEAPQ
jgi:anti-sigma factor RsiW